MGAPSQGAGNAPRPTFWSLLPIALSVFLLASLTAFRLRGGVAGESSVFATPVVALYEFFGFEPAFMGALLVLTWSSIWFLTGQLERPADRLLQILTLTFCLAILVNLRSDGVAPPHGGVLGAFFAERLYSVFGFILSTFVMSVTTIVLLFRATDSFFIRYFENAGRGRPGSAADDGVETQAVDELQSLQLHTKPQTGGGVRVLDPEVTVRVDPNAVLDLGPSEEELEALREELIEREVERQLQEDDGDESFEPEDDPVPVPDVISGQTEDDIETAEEQSVESVANSSDDDAVEEEPVQPEFDETIRVTKLPHAEFVSSDSDSDSDSESDAMRTPPLFGREQASEPSAPVTGPEMPPPEFGDPYDELESIVIVDDPVVASHDVEPEAPAGIEPSESDALHAADDAADLEETSDTPHDEPVVELPALPPDRSRQPSLFGEIATDRELVSEAADLVVEQGRASASLLRRRLRISTDEAVEVLGALDRLGVVECPNGASQGRVLMDAEDWQQLRGAQ